MMTERPRSRTWLDRLAGQEDLNFLLTNRIPRQLTTRLMGWFSKIEQPLVRVLSMAVWRAFTDLDLSEARKTSFRSVHDCFTRELKDGVRPVNGDPSIVTSPCDAIVGACGRIAETELWQIKGLPYRLDELVPDERFVREYRDGLFVTLRLTSSMYHRFHAPHDCVVEQVDYISGDTWNVNPVALKRIEKLFCKNERAAIRTRLVTTGHSLTLVPVAAILVASIRLHFLDVVLGLEHKGANRFVCHAPFRKGEEIGWFEHGSTIVLFAPEEFALADGVLEGTRIRMGEALLRLPAAAS